MTDLIWRNESRKVSELVPHVANPRTMTEKQVADLTASIEKFNLVEIPVVDQDNTIIAGHQRLAVMKLIGRGDEVVDVRVPNRKLTGEERDEYLLRSNANVGSWDWGALAGFDEDFLRMVGFGEDVLRMNFGLDDAENANVEGERVMALIVLPPESVRLKERAEIHLDSWELYEKVRDAVKENRITAADLLKLSEKNRA